MNSFLTIYGQILFFILGAWKIIDLIILFDYKIRDGGKA